MPIFIVSALFFAIMYTGLMFLYNDYQEYRNKLYHDAPTCNEGYYRYRTDNKDVLQNKFVCVKGYDPKETK